MNDSLDIDDNGFEARLERELQSATATIDPDVERARRAVRDTNAGERRPQRLLAVAAVLAFLGGGLVALNQRSSTGDDVLIGVADEQTTTVTADPAPAPSTTAQETGELATTVVPRGSVPAAEIPPVATPLTGGDAVQIVRVTSTPGNDEVSTSVQVFSDIGDVLSADGADGPFTRRFDDTLFVRRNVLDLDLPVDTIASALREASGSEETTPAEADDRLWDDAVDLVVSGTLTNDQRALLFETLEQELGAEFALVPASTGEILVIRWDGHSEGEPRALHVETATGVAFLMLEGGVDVADSNLTAVTEYSVTRVSVADLVIAPPPPSEEPGVAEFAFALDGGGLVSIDPDTTETTLVPFGSARRSVVELVEMSYGPAGGEMLLSECGGGELLAVTWGSLTLHFDPDAGDPSSAAFLGWAVDGDVPVATMADGLGVGSSIEDVMAARPGELIEDSTLGVEYFDGATSWLSTAAAGEGLIDAFWAGASCVFR